MIRIPVLAGATLLALAACSGGGSSAGTPSTPGALYFRADDGVTGSELWKTDGTAAGTALVKDIRTVPSPIAPSAPRAIAAFNGALYFIADDGVHGLELWKSDGTEAGTVLLRDINPAGSAFFGATTQQALTAFNGALYFSANDGSGNELWRTDGTEAGTRRVKDIIPGAGAGSPTSLTVFNGALYFSANDGASGDELWKSDGTDAGTVRVKDINPGSGGSGPSGLIVFEGALYFSASDGTSGQELWMSDGTSAGTLRVKDIHPTGSSGPGWLTVLDGALYFTADDGLHGIELWKSDGTEAGTVLVKDIDPAGDSTPENLVACNGFLYFTAVEGGSDVELWKSDGTEAGTVRVRDINTGGSALPQELTCFDRDLYFTADDGVSGRELWKSDGTEAGSARVKDIYPGPQGGVDFSPAGLTVFNGALYFQAFDGNGLVGVELWKSDGTEFGTVLVKDICQPNCSSSPSGFTPF